MHCCVNLVCRPAGHRLRRPAAAGEVVAGSELALARRTASGVAARDVDLARGPARLAGGARADRRGRRRRRVRHRAGCGCRRRAVPTGQVRTGPRVGVGGAGGRRDPAVAVLDRRRADRVGVPARGLDGAALGQACPSWTPSVSDVLDELQWRGLIALSTDEEALRAALAAGPVTYYCGFDPTAPSLHIGNLVQILTVRRLQQAGHRPLALVGGATGLIGDPKPTARADAERPRRRRGLGGADPGRRSSRSWTSTARTAARMVNNLDWTAPMSAIDLLRDVGKHFRVNRMLAKEAVSARLDSEDGISYTEFSYQILQGMDFLELYRRYGCTLQIGGIGPVGQPDRRRRPDPPGRAASRARARHPADDQGGRHQVRQDRGRHRLARPRR